MSSPGSPMPPGGGGPQIPPQLVQLAVQYLMMEVQRGKMLAAAAQMVQAMQQGGAPAGGPAPSGPAPQPAAPGGPPRGPVGMRPTQ
jgi:hypothetical protein